jgi:ankyrin repeat protein
MKKIAGRYKSKQVSEMEFDYDYEHTMTMFNDPQKFIKMIKRGKLFVNARDRRHELTPLHDAINIPDVPYEVIEVLIAKGADVNAVSADGVTPLMLAEKIGDYVIIDMLIIAGAIA